MCSAGDIATTYSEKMQLYMKEFELYVMAGQLDKAELASNRAVNLGNTMERQEMKDAIKEFYIKEAEALEKNQKKRAAMEIYEKLMRTALSDREREIIKKRLIDLYDKFGKYQESRMLKGL